MILMEKSIFEDHVSIVRGQTPPTLACRPRHRTSHDFNLNALNSESASPASRRHRHLRLHRVLLCDFLLHPSAVAAVGA